MGLRLAKYKFLSRRGCMQRIRKDVTLMSVQHDAISFCNDKYKGSCMPLFLRIWMHGVEEKRYLYTWRGFFPIRMRYLAKPRDLHDSWKRQGLTFLATWFAGSIVCLTASRRFDQIAEKPRRASILQFVSHSCSQQLFSLNLCNLPRKVGFQWHGILEKLKLTNSRS